MHPFSDTWKTIFQDFFHFLIVKWDMAPMITKQCFEFWVQILCNILKVFERFSATMRKSQVDFLHFRNYLTFSNQWFLDFFWCWCYLVWIAVECEEHEKGIHLLLTTKSNDMKWNIINQLMDKKKWITYVLPADLTDKKLQTALCSNQALDFVWCLESFSIALHSLSVNVITAFCQSKQFLSRHLLVFCLVQRDKWRMQVAHITLNIFVTILLHNQRQDSCLVPAIDSSWKNFAISASLFFLLFWLCCRLIS